MSTLNFVIAVLGAGGTSVGSWLVARARGERSVAAARAELERERAARTELEARLDELRARYAIDDAPSPQAPAATLENLCAALQLDAVALADDAGLLHAYAGSLAKADELAALAPWLAAPLSSAPRARALLRNRSTGELVAQAVRTPAGPRVLLATHALRPVGGYALERALSELGHPVEPPAARPARGALRGPDLAATSAPWPDEAAPLAALEALRARWEATALWLDAERTASRGDASAETLAHARDDARALHAALHRASRAGLDGAYWAELRTPSHAVAVLETPSSYARGGASEAHALAALLSPTARTVLETQRLEGQWARAVREALAARAHAA